MLQFDLPHVESIQGTPRADGGRHFLFVTMPEGDPFDLIGPMAVMREANLFLEASGRADLCYSHEVVCNVPGTVFETAGFRMQVDRACYDVQGPVDTVVFQAIDLEGRCLLDERFIEWVRQISQGARRMVTACLGSYILAEAGLLDGRRAASHWAVSRHFTQRYPDVEFDRDPIYIKDGKFYTSAGMTSIIDLMMALV
ncbi:MAG TPA: DJ-1/PfpI family protein, partial [Longimicrobiales bacterium]|nr:DJ-1/PfpI family protein [Longimicrobiales bacterium]